MLIVGSTGLGMRKSEKENLRMRMRCLIWAVR